MPMTCAAARPPERSTPAYLLTAACSTAVLPGVHELGAVIPLHVVWQICTATLHMLYTHVYTHEDCVYTL